jgi:outer membrane immunogenic protein
LRAPYKSPAFVAPAYFSWSGFYIGINGGYGFGKSSWTGPPSTGDFNVKGPIVGATLGYNYQTGSWVWGLEADADYSAIKGSTSTTCAPSACEINNTWLATGRARIGYAWDRWLPYITGGAAFGNEKATYAGNSESKTKLGWTAGLGVEYAFLGAWSAKLEYLYVDLGKWNCSAATCGAASDVKFNANLVRVGVNYRF